MLVYTRDNAKKIYISDVPTNLDGLLHFHWGKPISVAWHGPGNHLGRRWVEIILYFTATHSDEGEDGSIALATSQIRTACRLPPIARRHLSIPLRLYHFLIAFSQVSFGLNNQRHVNGSSHVLVYYRYCSPVCRND